MQVQKKVSVKRVDMQMKAHSSPWWLWRRLRLHGTCLLELLLPLDAQLGQHGSAGRRHRLWLKSPTEQWPAMQPSMHRHAGASERAQEACSLIHAFLDKLWLHPLDDGVNNAPVDSGNRGVLHDHVTESSNPVRLPVHTTRGMGDALGGTPRGAACWQPTTPPEK